MKTRITLLLATLISSATFARDEGRLTITLAAQNNVQVLIDNRMYRLNDNSIVLNNIEPGRHTVQVYSGSGYSNGRNNGNSRNRNDRNNLLYSSTITVRPNYHVDIMINRFGKALVDERDLRYTNDRWDNDNRYERNDDYRDNDNRYRQAMRENEFDQFVKKIRSQWFGNAKMSIAKDGLTENYFTTPQVRHLLQLFSSESDKLQLAKLAYRRTVDQRNYHQLYDVFSSRRNRNELEQYIRNNRW